MLVDEWALQRSLLESTLKCTQISLREHVEAHLRPLDMLDAILDAALLNNRNPGGAGGGDEALGWT